MFLKNKDFSLPIHLKPNERDPVLYLEDIELAMKRVQEYIAGLDFQQFKWDYKTLVRIVKKNETTLQND